ncbi:MAG: aminotransferase class V-fold PLP-dependent enzyme [Clostridia bacterium]|nr:aminotransferase class V-fold PLP-dependent enzyme [Clostridia bacterium]
MIYLDCAATSRYKPPCVGERMGHYMRSVCATVNRGAYALQNECALELQGLREALDRLFGVGATERAIITPGATYSLNMAILGALRAGDGVLVSSMEHNSVMRPLTALARRGVRVDIVPCDSRGEVDLVELRSRVRGDTRMIVLNHASNVCGHVQPAAAVGELARERGLLFVLDASQSAGYFPVNMRELGADAIAVSGHKGLMGPCGIGALLLSERMAQCMEPIVSGGTGSYSDSDEQPGALPDKFESGTPNMPGVYGLAAAVRYVESVGVERIGAHVTALAERFAAELRGLDGVRVIGGDFPCLGVVSVAFEHMDNAVAAHRLEREYGLLTRCGLHCAPWAHRTLGTFPEGAVRFSFGHYTSEADVCAAVRAIGELTRAR